MTNRQAILLSSQEGGARVALRYSGGSCDPTLGDGTAADDAYLEGRVIVVNLHEEPGPKPEICTDGPVIQTALDVQLPEGRSASSVAVRSEPPAG